MRTNNEDAFIAESIRDGRYVLACVIDGVGGYEGGEVAAQIARDTILEKLQAETNDLSNLMRTALILANEKIYEERSRNAVTASMACVLTLVVADTDNNQFWYAHVGDTRLYLLRDRSLVKVTKDHSFVGFLEDNQRISEQEAMQHPKRNEVNKALGFDPNIGLTADYIETGVSPFLPGDLLMLCSDGLSDLLDNQQMLSILTTARGLQQKTNALIDAANAAGGKDNITVVLVENNKQPLKQKAMRPAVVKKNPRQDLKDKTAQPVAETPEPKKTKGPLIFLCLLCLLLAGAAAFFWSQWQSAKEKNSTAINTLPSQAPPDARELALAASLNSGPVLILTDTLAGTTVLSRSLNIDRDTLQLLGMGAVLEADSLFNEAAFLISPQSRFVLLQDIVLKNFDIGILHRSGALHLKNVRFLNCRVPVRYDPALRDSVYVSGQLGDSLWIATDSLPKQEMP